MKKKFTDLIPGDIIVFYRNGIPIEDTVKFVSGGVLKTRADHIIYFHEKQTVTVLEKDKGAPMVRFRYQEGKRERGVSLE